MDSGLGRKFLNHFAGPRKAFLVLSFEDRRTIIEDVAGVYKYKQKQR